MKAGFRPEIQALRAVSVLLVVLFHLWPDRLQGGYVGVDVFFVISGYLITSHLLREVDSTGSIKLSQFYARRIRRLLPAALLVLAATVVAVIVWVPRSSWILFMQEIAASALYVVNWVLAFNSVDYFAQDNAPSPVQHYWSLSVEEQFYLAWPLLLLAVVLVTRRATSFTRKLAITGVLVAVFLGCLAYSIIATNDSQTFAYFATPAHGWEFAAGGILALWLPSTLLVAGAHVRTAASWIGFALVIGSGIVLTGASAFPGYIALVPTIGALLVIAAGTPSTAWSPRVFVRLRPVQFIGDISYSLYLWHWMPIVILPFVLGHGLGIVEKVLILFGAIALAWLTKITVEDPIRTAPRLRPRRLSYSLAAGVTLLVVASAVIPLSIVSAENAAARNYVETVQGGAIADPCFGAAATLNAQDCPSSHVVNPAIGPTFATDDSQRGWLEKMQAEDPYYTLNCAVVEGTVIQRCEIGSDDPTLTVALVGDSHSNHLLRPLVELAKKNNWRVIQMYQGSCRPVIQSFESNVVRERDSACQEWKNQIFDYVAADPAIDVVMTSGATQGYNLGDRAIDRDAVAAAFVDTWKIWTDAGKSVLAVSDVPRAYGFDVPTCIAESGVELDPCAIARNDVVGPDAMLDAGGLVNESDIAVVDLYPYFCDDDTCHFVVGGVITHKDNNHMTSTFSSSLAPMFEDALDTLVEARKGR